MDFNDTPEQAEFRKTCRKWLEDNAKLKSGNQVEDFANIDFFKLVKIGKRKNMMQAGLCCTGQKNMVVSLHQQLKE
jgi:hypothetical protein